MHCDELFTPPCEATVCSGWEQRWRSPCGCTDGLGALGDHPWSLVPNLHLSVPGKEPSTHRLFPLEKVGKWQETNLGESLFPTGCQADRHRVLTQSCLSAGLCFHLSHTSVASVSLVYIRSSLNMENCMQSLHVSLCVCLQPHCYCL